MSDRDRTVYQFSGKKWKQAACRHPAMICRTSFHEE
jgi:hypothetical protein